MRQLYTFGVRCYGLAVLLASFFSSKAKKWVSGRSNWRTTLKEQLSGKEIDYWFHCASLGEFEQGRPVMEALKKQNPELQILISFFSPSGYEIRKDYALADVVCYLPIDTSKNAKDFLEIVTPKQVLFIKYEFWYNYISALKNADIPLYFVSSAFRKDQLFFKWYGAWFRNQLLNISCFFVQNSISLSLLKSVGIEQAVLSGDTRYDRVADLAKTAPEVQWVDEFKSGKKLIVVGSSWQPDEEIIAQAVERFPEIQFIIAPHEIYNERIKSLESRLAEVRFLRLSQFENQPLHNHRVVIIDSIGLLNRLYRYADFAWVGGGFGSGLHNILEAATYGVPVFYGNQTERFPEAEALKQAGGGFEMDSARCFFEKLEELLASDERYNKVSKASKAFIETQAGATKTIVSYLNKN